MVNVLVQTTVTNVLPSVPRDHRKRNVVLQNQSPNTIYLQFDNDPSGGPLSSALGFQLLSGQALQFSPTGVGGSDGQQRIDAIATVANSVLHVQTSKYLGE